MSFNLGVIPPDKRTKEQIAVHLELYNRSMDICLIHNPTKEDFLFYNDRRFMKNPYIVPNENKDVGYGKGNLEVRRYLANAYVRKMGEAMITKISEDDWKKKKLNYREEERGKMEEGLAIRTNNRKLWEKILPQLFLGVVRRHEEENGMGEAIPEQPKKPTSSLPEDVMESLGLTDKEISLAAEAQQEELSTEEQKKADLLQSLT